MIKTGGSIMILFLLAVFFTSCTNINTTVDDTVDFQTQYVRTFAHNNSVYPVITVISSEAELEQYHNEKVSTSYETAYTGFTKAIQGYTDLYFSDNFLVIALLEVSSGSIRLEVDKIKKNGDIVINRFIPKVGTCDMAEWNIIIELNNNFKSGKYELNFVDKRL